MLYIILSVLSVFVLVLLLVVFCCLRISSRISRLEEAYEIKKNYSTASEKKKNEEGNYE